MIKRVAFIESMPIQSFEADTIAIVEYFARYLSNYYSFYEYDTQLRSIYYGYCEVAIPFRMSEKRQLQIIHRMTFHLAAILMTQAGFWSYTSTQGHAK